ncbi:MAG: DUF6090 family protein [Cellulophaga sp.]
MIKFFRKIRQNLLSEGKTGKYLKYAVGEIVLVVIGILIALQINNWNEYQKQLKTEKEILKELKIGLESDYNNITTSIDDHLEFIRSQEIIIDWIDRNYEYNDSLIPHFKHMHFTSLFFPKDAQFKSLNQFGLRNISNKALGDQLTDLYDFIYKDILYWQNEYKNTSIDFRSTLDELGFEFVKDTTEITIDQKPTDPTALQSNKAFLYNLKGTSATLKIYTEHKLKIARKEILKTINMIEKEIEQD